MGLGELFNNTDTNARYRLERLGSAFAFFPTHLASYDPAWEAEVSCHR